MDVMKPGNHKGNCFDMANLLSKIKRQIEKTFWST